MQANRFKLDHEKQNVSPNHFTEIIQQPTDTKISLLHFSSLY